MFHSASHPSHPRRPRGSGLRRRTVAAAVLVSLVSAGLAAGNVAASAEEGSQADFVAMDRARAAGLATRTKNWAASPVDYDRDGDEDVWIGYHGRGGKLWKNRGNGTYRRVARRAWPRYNSNRKTIDRHDCAWADVDRNGRPDAYCSAGRFKANVVKHNKDNELWLQGRQGGFREVGTAWRLGDACGRGRTVAFLHANGDRWPDLFLGNENPRKVKDPCNRRSNKLPNEHSKVFINLRGKGFRYTPRFWNYGAGPGTQCAEVVDFNGDGRDDLLACRRFNETPRLYVNRSNRRFADVTSRHRLGRRVTDAAVGDIDGDGDPDLVTSAVRGYSYHLNQNGRFGVGVWIAHRKGAAGRSVALGDADDDGDLDVYGLLSSPRGHNPDDVIWLNDRLHFMPVSVPPADGHSNKVVALHPGRSRNAQFLVLNGFGYDPKGPIQLIRMTRR